MFQRQRSECVGGSRRACAFFWILLSLPLALAQQPGQLVPLPAGAAPRSAPLPAPPRDPQSASPTTQPAATQPFTESSAVGSLITPRVALPAVPIATTQPTPSAVLEETPDPVDAPAVLAERLRNLQASSREPRVANSYRRVVEEANRLLAQVHRGRQVRLGLAECVQRALQNNYTIRSQSYNPAIADTVVVEAEAAFDAAFFLDVSDVNRDAPTASELASGQSDLTSVSGGFRQLLPSGMQAQVGLRQQRTFTDLQFATINPAWESVFFAELRQPLLRGFGLDFNRSQIEIAKTDRRIAAERFEQQVRDTLLDVESAYWTLVRARRAAAIQAESVAQNFVTFQSIRDRAAHDATPVALANSESRWRSRYVVYLETIKLVRDAEDRLKNLMNDPELKLSEELELIPTETPLVSALLLDHFAEVRSALENRSEIKQARLAIDRNRIGTNRAKNQTLPQLDVTFQYEVAGLERTSDDSFDRLTTNRFRSYTVNVAFSYPIGNRAARSAFRRARLSESQAIADLNRVTDGVVEEVNAAIRTLVVRWEQIAPQYEAVRSADRNLASLQARAQRVDPSYLETELSAVEQLADSRSRLVGLLTDYNTALVALERAKGTLLQYNNVSVANEPARR